MAFYDDYIMRQIEDLARMLGNMLFQREEKTIALFDAEGNLSETGLIYHRLRGLIADNQLDQAENLLFEELERKPTQERYRLAYQFYTDLQALPEDRLQLAGFTREEILEGFQDVQALSRREGLTLEQGPQ